MARKHFNILFNNVERQFAYAMGVLKDKQLEMANEMVSPEDIKNIQDITLPIIKSYKCVSYVNFLLEKGKKQVDRDYLQKVSNKEHTKQNIDVLTEEVKNGIADEYVLQSMKKVYQQILDDLSMWEYLMFVLNKPNKKCKEKKYIAQNIGLLLNPMIYDEMIKANEDAIKKLKEY